MFQLFRSCILFLTLLSATAVSGQLYTEILWQNTLGSYQEDYLTDIVPAPNGGFLVTGYSNSSFGFDKSEAPVVFGYDDYWAILIDSAGNKLWDEVYGGNDDDKLQTAVPLPDGGFLLAGMSQSEAGYDRTEPNMGTGEDYWVIRIDSMGNILWDAAYGGAEWDQLYHAIHTDDDGFLLIGWSRSYAGFDKSEDPIGGAWDRDYWIVKIDSAGDLEWENTIGGNNGDEAAGGVQTSDGGYLIIGHSSSGAGADKSDPHHGLPGIPRDDYWLVKLNAEGEVVWDKTIGGTEHDVPNGILDCGDNTFVLYGYSYSGPGFEKSESHRGYGDYWMVKVDESGNVLWDKTIGGSQSDRATCAAKISEDYYLFGGTSWSPVNFDKTEANHGEADYWIVGTDGTGQVQWDDVIGCDEEEDLKAMFLFEDGNVLFAGDSDSDTCSDKNEMNKSGATNEPDYFITKMRAYEFISKYEIINTCFDSTYTLPWGQVVDTFGVFTDTIFGEFLDTLYQVELIQSLINDSLINYVYFVEVVDYDADLYTWIDCNTGDTVSSGEWEFGFWPWYEGDFAVIIEKGECVDTSDCYALFPGAITHHAEGYTPLVYPNPGGQVVSIHSAVRVQNVVVTDLSGRVLSEQPVNNIGTCTIDLSVREAGCYFLIFQLNDRYITLPYYLIGN